MTVYLSLQMPFYTSKPPFDCKSKDQTFIGGEQFVLYKNGLDEF